MVALPSPMERFWAKDTIQIAHIHPMDLFVTPVRVTQKLLVCGTCTGRAARIIMEDTVII